MTYPMPSQDSMRTLKEGIVIPASPLALDEKKRLDERYQRAIYRYYVAAGARGVAVGVHTTQFEIRDNKYNLFKPILSLASEELHNLERQCSTPIVKIAGICGKTSQAVAEASYARTLNYDAGLLSLSAFRDEDEQTTIAHCREVAKMIPLMGFYLQPSVGGKILSYSFWRQFCEIENVIAIKIAPFNRYHTFDVIRGVFDSKRDEEIALYTGNDDNIIIDLLTPYEMVKDDVRKTLHIKGGLLGQWAIWTKTAVGLLDSIHKIREGSAPIPVDMLKKNAQLTEANAAVFDSTHNFRGCIAGINEILRRQGLMRTSHCLSEKERMSPGQMDEILRAIKAYPWLIDDEFVREHLDEWLR